MDTGITVKLAIIKEEIYYRGFPLLISEVKMQLTKVLNDLYDAIIEFKEDDIKTLERINSIICSLSLDEINAHFSQVNNKYFLIHFVLFIAHIPFCFYLPSYSYLVLFLFHDI
jgi:hypothetical protein